MLHQVLIAMELGCEPARARFPASSAAPTAKPSAGNARLDLAAERKKVIANGARPGSRAESHRATSPNG
jgi:hypothetical protein